MTLAGLPDRDTLVEWMSSFLDGELPAEQEAILLRAMEEDPEILEIFETLSDALGDALHHPLAAAEARELTQNVLLATAPAALANAEAPGGDAEAEQSALMWASMRTDDALDEASAQRLLADACLTPQTAQNVVAFVQAKEKVGDFLAEWPQHAATEQTFAELSAQVSERVRQTEQRHMAWSATIDGELGTVDFIAFPTEEDAEGALAFACSSDMIGEALREAIADPAAQRAGASALQVIAAQTAQAADAGRAQRQNAADVRVPASRPKRPWWQLLPVAGVAAAALGLAIWSPSASSPTPTDEESAPNLAAWAEPTSAWQPLPDNTAEVQSLDSGSQMAAVFATDASQITVIWVAEPDDEVQTETGT